jgi:hypothetical protein
MSPPNTAPTRRHPDTEDSATWGRAVAIAVIAFCLLATQAWGGVNAEAQLSCTLLSPACGVRGGDQVNLAVSAEKMGSVRIVKLIIGWYPADAVVAVGAAATGLAQQGAFVVPGAPIVEGGTAEFGMATFGDGISGGGAIANLAVMLAAGIDSTTAVDVWIERAELGASYAERDTLYPHRAVVLINYCDLQGLPLQSSISIRPSRREQLYSAREQAQIADGSPGEALFGARILGSSSSGQDQYVTWTIHNTGAVPVNVVGAAQPVSVEPGGVLTGVSLSDATGISYLILDAGASPPAAGGSAELEACGETSNGVSCAAASVSWHGSPTAITQPAPLLPLRARLFANYPNPFNGETVLPLDVADNGTHLTLSVHDALGRTVRTLTEGALPSGTHRFVWDGRNAEGRPVASGAYFCRLQQDDGAQVVPMVLLR